MKNSQNDPGPQRTHHGQNTVHGLKGDLPDYVGDEIDMVYVVNVAPSDIEAAPVGVDVVDDDGGGHGVVVVMVVVMVVVIEVAAAGLGLQ
jgi:hypothetical protein